MNGAHHFNEVILDEAFVPDDMVFGEIGDGWQQVTSELSLRTQRSRTVPVHLRAAGGLRRPDGVERHPPRSESGAPGGTHRRPAPHVHRGGRRAGTARARRRARRSGQGARHHHRGRHRRIRRPAGLPRFDLSGWSHARWISGRDSPCAVAPTRCCAASSRADWACDERRPRRPLVDMMDAVFADYREKHPPAATSSGTPTCGGISTNSAWCASPAPKQHGGSGAGWYEAAELLGCRGASRYSNSVGRARFIGVLAAGGRRIAHRWCGADGCLLDKDGSRDGRAMGCGGRPRRGRVARPMAGSASPTSRPRRSASPRAPT